MPALELRAVAEAETRAVETHLRAFFGAEASIVPQSPPDEGPLRSRAPFFSAFEIAPARDLEFWTYVSVGSLSEPMLEDPHNVEFVIASRTRDARMVQRLAVNTYYHCGPPDQRLDLDHRVPVGEPWVPGATVDASLVSLPYPYGEALEHVHWDERHTRLLWLTPITQSELVFARRVGNEPLEDLFEVHRIDYLDLARPPVV